MEEFPGEANQTRCFNHILSLVAKSVVQMFDVPKKNAEGGELSRDEALLQTLAEGIELEERETRERLGRDEDLDDDLDWEDDAELLTADEKAELDASILPVRMLIVKVGSSASQTRSRCDRAVTRQLRKLAFKIINSTTAILPAWKALLAALKLKELLMPRDVTTRWNSTFDMLDFAVNHRKALDLLAQDRANGLREYELSKSDWQIAQQLRDVLKVRTFSSVVSLCSLSFFRSSKTRHSSSLVERPISQR